MYAASILGSLIQLWVYVQGAFHKGPSSQDDPDNASLLALSGLSTGMSRSVGTTHTTVQIKQSNLQLLF